MKLFFAIITLYSFSVLSVTNPTKLKNLTFSHTEKVSKVNFWLNTKQVTFHKKFNLSNKQLVLEISPIISKSTFLRGFDTSEFKGSIVYISFKEIKNDTLQVILQLRENVSSEVKKYANRLSLNIENYYGAFGNQDLKQKIVNQEVSIEKNVRIPKSTSMIDLLENLTFSGAKKYLGSKITINVKNIKISNLLKMIAEASGFNIIQSAGIRKLPILSNLTLIETRWDEALDIILKLNKLSAERSGAILIIKTLTEDSNDREEKERLKKLTQKQEDIVTKLFPISYSKIEDLKKIVKQYLTPRRGRISSDKRTNTLIIKDTVTVIEKIKKIIKILDTQTPQVLIQARIVEVKDSVKSELGLKQGIGFSSPAGNTAFSLSSAPAIGSPLLSIPKLASAAPGLSFALSLLETESSVKIVSSPRVVTKNNEAATITSSSTVNYLVTSESLAGGTTGKFETKRAHTDLTVTPHITNEGSIALDIKLDKNDLGDRDTVDGPPTQTASTMTTNVIVDNGSTIALGGAFHYTTQKATGGIPYLRHLPLFGWLFRSADTTSISKKEVIIFITPRILNKEKSGISETL